MTLIALRTTGVSANRRRFTGVGLGSRRPGNWTGVRIAGSASVFLAASASAAPAINSAFRPFPACPPWRVVCRHISRNCSPTLTSTFLPFPAQNKRHSPGKGYASEYSSQLSVVSYVLTASKIHLSLNKFDPIAKTVNYLQNIRKYFDRKSSYYKSESNSRKLTRDL
jgi:hypothetical protein